MNLFQRYQVFEYTEIKIPQIFFPILQNSFNVLFQQWKYYRADNITGF
jgi:hypothetical protein